MISAKIHSDQLPEVNSPPVDFAMNSRTEAVYYMNPAESQPVLPKPVKYIFLNPSSNQTNVDMTIEKASMMMKAYSSVNDTNKMTATSSIENQEIMILSSSKSVANNHLKSISTAPNFNPVNNQSSLNENDSWVNLSNTYNITKPYPVGYPIMNDRPIQGNIKPSDYTISLLKGHGLPESNLKGLHRKMLVMNPDDPNEFAEFKKHFTLSPENETFRNNLLASTKKANFAKTSMVTILFNLVNICEKHVFDQSVHVQILMNIVCEITEIPECEKFASKIRSKCKHVLSQSFNDMNAIVDQCAKLQTVQTNSDTENSISKAQSGNIKIEPEDLENEVDIPMADENVKEKNQVELSIFDKKIKEDNEEEEIGSVNEEEEEEIGSVNEEEEIGSVNEEEEEEIGSVNEEEEEEIGSVNEEEEEEIGSVIEEEEEEIGSANEEEEIGSVNEGDGQIKNKDEYADQIESENEDAGQMEGVDDDVGQIKSVKDEADQIKWENEDADQIESGNDDAWQFKSENEDAGQIERENIYRDADQMGNEMEEENQIESVLIDNGTKQINALNFNEYFAVENYIKRYVDDELQKDTGGYFDNLQRLSDNENDTSELEESESEAIDENLSTKDPDWEPDEHFESSGTAKRPMEAKECKKPKKRGGLCQICGKNMKCLKDHMLTHKIDRPEKCPHCDFRAKCTKSLRNHMNIHSSERNFQCEMCGEQFCRLEAVKKHLIVHSKQLLYSCQYCPNKYKRKVTLARHEKIHKEEYAYTCNVCKKKFIQAINLKTHMRTHTGEKPYKCDRCGKGFAHNVTKKLHRKTCFVQNVTEK